MYGSHHKKDSPLLRLKIDMIKDFPVGDSLHLLHLGIMKKQLFGFRDGIFRNSDTKWSSKTTFDVSDYLRSCKMPAEFKRKVRGLDSLAHWKGSEYRIFLHYIGPIVLKTICKETRIIIFCYYLLRLLYVHRNVILSFFR